MKKIIPVFLLSGLLAGCGTEAKNETGSEKKEAEVTTMQEEQEEITFISGVNDSNVTQANAENYTNIKGKSLGNKTVYVIYEGTIIDEIETDNYGEFKYYSRSNKDKTNLIFTNDSSLRPGDLGVHKDDLSNYKEITVLPNEDYINREEKKEEEQEEINNAFSIGDSVTFSSDSNDNIAITINSLDTFQGDKWDQPEGVYFLKVSYTIENLSTQEYSATAHMFSVYDGKGEKADRISKDYFSEDIIGGKKASGVSYFDVRNEGPFEVHAFGAYWAGDVQ